MPERVPDVIDDDDNIIVTPMAVQPGQASEDGRADDQSGDVDADGSDAEVDDEQEEDGPERSIADKAADEHDADILLLNAPIGGGLSALTRAVMLKRKNRRDNVIVILVSSGGIADDAYRTATAIQSMYDKVSVCVSGWCKSAGTLMAIGAHELIFGCHGELGPLDVQIAVKDEIVDNRDSGLILDAAIKGLNTNSFRVFEKFMTSIIEHSSGAITFRTAADLAADITVGLMSPIYEKIDPLRMGADQRAQNIGFHYAARLNFKGENLEGPEALNMLLNGYPSHGFVIDMEEAQRMFTNVKPLEGYLEQTVESLGKLARFPGDEPLVCYLDGDDDGEGAGTAKHEKEPEADPPAPEDGKPGTAPKDVSGAIQTVS
jgi:hypothetical protein